MIALIDADSILYQSLPKKHNPDATYEQCLEEMNTKVTDVITGSGADSYVLFLTTGNCFRYKVNNVIARYKNNRKVINKHPFFYALKQVLRTDWNAYELSMLEADDLVCYFSKQLEDTIICSPDKDVLYQSAGRHYDYRKKEFVDVTKEEADRFLFQQVATGDRVDGIEGLHGVGPVVAGKWFDNRGSKSYEQVVLGKYIERFGIPAGISKFYETFRMVYMLKTDEDMLREINFIPAAPEIGTLLKQTEHNVDDLI